MHSKALFKSMQTLGKFDRSPNYMLGISTDILRLLLCSSGRASSYRYAVRSNPKVMLQRMKNEDTGRRGYRRGSCIEADRRIVGMGWHRPSTTTFDGESSKEQKYVCIVTLLMARSPRSMNQDKLIAERSSDSATFVDAIAPQEVP